MNAEQDLASKIFFAKEAAGYLGITTQRLNKLTNEGRIIPLKKNASGTIYYIRELERRKEELSIFSDEQIARNCKESGNMFKIDNPTRHEALNFATIMNVTGRSEKVLSADFDELSSEFDISIPIIENPKPWVLHFNVNEEILCEDYHKAKRKFEALQEDDEIIKKGNSDYPELLAATDEAPRFLYLRGNTALLYNTKTVALVGSRNASEKAKANTERLAVALGRNGIIVVSGLARGIDVTAHKAALANGFYTIAVIGTNLNQYYPSENKDVQKEIESKGLVISQFSPATKTERWFFPMRNGVMSGLSQATVVMEAGETSGALKQATFALKQKRLVLIPKNVFSIENISWPEKLLSQGAICVSTPRNIIEILSDKNVFGNILDNEKELPFINGDNDSVAEGQGEYNAD